MKLFQNLWAVHIEVLIRHHQIYLRFPIAIWLIPFYSEVVVYSKELGIAGTIDVLVYNREQDMYHLVDWKTNKRIDKKSFRKKY